MNCSDYPRVAIVSSCPLRSDVASGMMMQSLFADWPRDRLAQVYFPVIVNDPPDTDVCGDARRIQTLGTVRRFDAGTARRPTAPSRQSGRRRSIVQQIRRRPQLHRWLKLAQDVWYAESWLGRVLRRELAQLRPDVVYALLGNRSLTKITCQACARLDLPWAVHVTDDFVETLYEPLPFAGPLGRSSDRWFRRAVAQANCVAAISPLMAREFAGRYGAAWDWFATAVDPAAYDPAPRRPDGTIQLLYAGNLGLGRWRTLRDLALALQALRAEGGMRCRLQIFAAPEQLSQYRAALNVDPVTDLRAWVSADKLPMLFRDADMLVHVESFDEQIASYTRLSFSTKLSQYLMAGRAILALGPQHLASLEMVREIGAGVAISASEPTALGQALRSLLEDSAKQRQSGAAGRLWAEQWLSESSVRPRFRAMLQRACPSARSHKRSDAAERRTA